MKTITPKKLQKGSHIRVIAPARSMRFIGDSIKQSAIKTLEKIGYHVSFGAHINEEESFVSASVKSRVEDFHEAFLDPQVDGILTVIGGYNSNQLLPYIDWEVVRSNPKFFCGYSDITVLQNSMLSQAGLVTYYGPHFSTFGQKIFLDYTIDSFKKVHSVESGMKIKESEMWSDDAWWINQEDRNIMKNEGFVSLQQGETEGRIVGGNLTSFMLLFGTAYMPDLEDAVLFLEEDSSVTAPIFDRNLQALLSQKEFTKVKGLVIGRLQQGSDISLSTLSEIISSKKELRNLPIITNADFGHTDPKITFPIGGRVRLKSSKNLCEITLL